MKRMLAAFLPFFLLCGCAPKPYSTDFFAMDTFMSVTVLGSGGEALAGQCEARINELENVLSRTREDSEVSRFNRGDGMLHEVGLLHTVRLLAEQTGGLFDPTIAPLVDLWGVGTENAHVPAQSEIEKALAKVNWENIEIVSDGQSARPNNGAQLDLGGIGKGYAADQCAAVLRDAGASGLLTLGGNVYAVGSNGGKDWVIGVADPDNNADFIATVAVQDKSVVTSGDYERYFEENGKRYHHIFDPRTGYPADSGLRSVTVIDENSTRADALTTALFVMGLADGMAFCEQNGVAAVFVTADKQVVTSPMADEACNFSFEGAEKGYAYAQ